MTPSPCRPRAMAPAGRLDADGHALKLHAIHLADRPAPSEAARSAASARARRVVPAEAEREGGAHGLGFAILHEGLQGSGLLLHGWAHGDILCGRPLRAEPGVSDLAPQDHRPLLACIWELAVIDRERRAWTRAMPTEAPDPDACLADLLPPGRALRPREMARLHAACFTVPRPWTAREFAQILTGPGMALLSEPGGFAVGRTAAGEAELLTLAVDPARRRLGAGRRLLAAFEARALRDGAEEAALEVAEGNAAARSLYALAGWREAGRRPGYYHDGQDALVLRKRLSRGPCDSS